MIRSESDRSAIVTLNRAMEDIANDLAMPFAVRQKAMFALHHAIRHLAYPERDTYPKVRRARKGSPVVRQR